MIRVLVAEQGAAQVREANPSELNDLLANPNVIVWVDVLGRTSECDTMLSESLGLHALVIEDIFVDAPNPKVEEYDNYLYVVVHGLNKRAESATHFETIELDVLIGERFVVTHRPESMRSIDAVVAELKRSPRLMQRGTAFLAHSIIDHITDHFAPLLDQFDEAIEQLEVDVMRGGARADLERMVVLRRSLLSLRRVSQKQRDVLHRLARGEFDAIPEAALPFYRDVDEHFTRLADLADAHREQISSVLVAYLSMQSNKLNEVMKLLTLMSAIMLPLTFIAGIYGMNFDYMPELHWKWGYPAVLGLMFVTGIGLYTYFRTRKWI